MQVDKVVINVPATTANLGPGFDAFGFALDVWNRVTVQRADEFSMTITGEGADRLKNDQSNMVAQMTAKAFAALGQEMPPLRFECQNAIPPTRGMGSSSAALVAGLAAGLALGGKDMSTPATKKLLLQLAATEEGHADNVAPAIYGGFQIAFNTEEQWITQRVALPEGLQCVLFIPDAEMSTTEARAVLPASVSYKDAIFNISRAAMLVNCFLAEAVSEAMLNEARKAGLPGTVHITTPSITGVNSVGTAADGTVLWSMDQSRTIKR